MIDDLYSARVLALVADMPRAGRLAAPQGSAEKVAKLCGSRIIVDVTLDEQGRVADYAQDVKACALGQATAAVLGAHVLGTDLAELTLTRDALRAMLKANGPVPTGRFSELSVLEPVKDYPARHASTLLAFEAAVEAVQAASNVRDVTKTRTSSAGAA
ncbi:iron-sulfur cluster assembly scaffold protein [Caulobacter segnis]|uniref:iron-sulfur cluster assembly scaffold protein n=1 Tax=Caulobacter segnis TaxID=88688 RepID=UPI00240EBDEB|nr:iron-sulfur cluster assembly scaffold protein [Caulobacter segnis]MDG2519944.1 iron-sulfur cluster assembly scaffold protein [Caulobacter segnis]